MAVLATDAATTNARSAQADARAALVAVIAGTMVDRNISQVEAAKFAEPTSLLCRRFCEAGQTASVSTSSFGGSWPWDARSSFALAATDRTIQQL